MGFRAQCLICLGCPTGSLSPSGGSQSGAKLSFSTWLRLALSCLPHSLSNRLHEAEEGAEPLLSAFSFQRLLSNLTALRLRVSRGPGRGGWLHKTSPWGPNWGGAERHRSSIRLSGMRGIVGGVLGQGLPPLCEHPWALKDVFWGLLCLSGAFQSRAEDVPSHSHTALPSRRQVVPERGPAHVCLPRAGHTGRLGGGVHVSHGIHRAVLPVLCTWIQEGDPIWWPLRQLRALHLQSARGLSPPHRCAPPGPSTHLSLHA